MGDKVLENIAQELQGHFDGLRGFSAQNLKKMRVFYETYPSSEIGSALLNQFDVGTLLPIGSALLNQLNQAFWQVGFTSHYLIISKTTDTAERIFYLTEIVKQGWSTRTLENHLKNNLYHNQKQLPNNFEATLPIAQQSQTLNQFRDEYLLDFISINEADDERLVEKRIVNNITQFILNMGKGFSFMGNQYRLLVNEQEFFVDLLFYNRHLQAMVAFELKRGSFKPQYAGQLNFYLNALNKQEKLDHENPSVGIILCREKDEVVVEYTLTGLNNPMGVATYITPEELPQNYRQILPPEEGWKQLLRNDDAEDVIQ